MIKRGSLIEHAVFGKGLVEEVEESAIGDKVLEIKFEGTGYKKLHWETAKAFTTVVGYQDLPVKLSRFQQVLNKTQPSKKKKRLR